MPFLLILILLFIPSMASGGSDRCYEGLDCPDDIPSDSRRPINPPPRRSQPVQPRHQPLQPSQPQQQPQQHLQQDCTNPQAAVMQNLYGGLLLGQQPTTPCTLPSTHCCFSDGSSVPLVNPGTVPYAGYCFVTRNLWGYPQVINGLGCRR